MKKLLVLLALCLILVSCGDEKKEDFSEKLDSAVEKYGPVFEAEDGTLISLYKSHEESA